MNVSDEHNLITSSCFPCLQQSHLHTIINHPFIQLSDLNRLIFKTRYLAYLVSTERRRNMLQVWYFGLRAFVHTGTIVTPAILSWQLFSHIELEGTVIAWFLWAMTILVGLFTQYIALFDLDRKYILYDVSAELIHKEIWRFIELSGSYQRTETCMTHDDYFTDFCNNMETIIKKINNKNHSYLEKNVERHNILRRSIDHGEFKSFNNSAHSDKSDKSNEGVRESDCANVPMLQDFGESSNAGRRSSTSRSRMNSGVFCIPQQLQQQIQMQSNQSNQSQQNV